MTSSERPDGTKRAGSRRAPDAPRGNGTTALAAAACRRDPRALRPPTMRLDSARGERLLRCPFRKTEICACRFRSRRPLKASASRPRRSSADRNLRVQISVAQTPEGVRFAARRSSQTNLHAQSRVVVSDAYVIGGSSGRPAKTTSRSRSTPNCSCARRRASSISATQSALVAMPTFSMKFACFGETIAPPIR